MCKGSIPIRLRVKFSKTAVRQTMLYGRGVSTESDCGNKAAGDGAAYVTPDG